MIGELYRGELSPVTHPSTPERKEANARLRRAESDLLALLDEEGEAAYERLTDAWMQRELRSEEDAFAEGIRFGITLMMELQQRAAG